MCTSTEVQLEKLLPYHVSNTTPRWRAYITALTKQGGQAKARGVGTGRSQNGNKKPGKAASAKRATDKGKGKAKADKSE